ncbi:stage II sporulation protein D [Ammoniphilus resinae]|uniref:Stage II sporulation protein D n=1 Tax=Ammoniphilus resinae TaxID=861532 RepID=A0ABS4GX03_9BACL|nr:stage II sporulation protein D [Ammoniphilus resinae]MBP1934804.1 stage II sporulation protein D [Ammoniphilus resinae]
MKRVGMGLAILLAITLLIPAIVTYFISDDETDPTTATRTTTGPPPSFETLKNQIPISVYRTESKQVEIYPIEEYITGVVAAEMPADFEMEALKAQALAARTYIIRRVAEKDFSDVPENAFVTDTIKHQVFLDEEQRKAVWGRDYTWKDNKVKQAVVETAGKVLTYDGKPINATFFSTSNGYTENSEEYWANKIPYLRSVEVPWDKESPKYQTKLEFPIRELEQKLNIRVASAASAPTAWSKVLDQTTGNRIGKMKIGEKEFSGREIREKLGLPSSAFEWQIQNGKVHITAFGYGHGVGMSQWGANGMAQEGKKADEIVQYFYKGIAIEDYHQWVKES